MKRTAEDNVRYVRYEWTEIEEVLYFPTWSGGSLNIYNEDSGSSITGNICREGVQIVTMEFVHGPGTQYT